MCSASCNAESIRYKDFGFYTPFAGETSTSAYTCDSGATGSAFYRASATDKAVLYIAFDTAGTNFFLTFANMPGRVCKATLANGQTYSFASVTSGTTTTYSTTGCPKKSCSQKIDMMLVMDESNSIDNTEWKSMKQFAVNFTRAFDISETETKIGIVPFAAKSTLRFPYQNDEQSFRNTMTKYVPKFSKNFLFPEFKRYLFVTNSPSFFYPPKIFP